MTLFMTLSWRFFLIVSSERFILNGGCNIAMYNEAGAATRSVWQIDPRLAQVKFSSKHLMFTTIKGYFKGVRGTIILDEADPVYSSVEVEIDTPNLYSGVQYRDNYLKSPDFLDVK